MFSFCIWFLQYLMPGWVLHQWLIAGIIVIVVNKAEGCLHLMPPNWTGKIMTVFKQFPQTAHLACYWSITQAAPPPNSRHWLNQKLGRFTNKSMFNFSVIWDVRKYFTVYFSFKDKCSFIHVNERCVIWRLIFPRARDKAHYNFGVLVYFLEY